MKFFDNSASVTVFRVFRLQEVVLDQGIDFVVIFFIKKINSKPEFLVDYCILFLASKHSLIHLTYRYYEIERKLINDVDNHAYEHGQSGVFKIC